MKKNTPGINEKLKTYSAIAGSIIAISNTAQGQIIYTDIIDQTVSGSSGVYNLDLDNSGGTNFKLNTSIFTTTSYNAKFYQVTVSPVGAGDEVGITTGLPSVLNLNDPIDNNLVWNPTVNQILAFKKKISSSSSSSSSSGSVAGNWLGKTNGYLPLRFVISSNTYYGWARLDVDIDAKQFTIKDYAYESTPGKMIPAGATVSGLKERDLDSGVKVFAVGKKVLVNLLGAEYHPGDAVRVMDVMGREITSVPLDNNVSNINLGDVSSGIYFVRVTIGNNSSTQKVLIY